MSGQVKELRIKRYMIKIPYLFGIWNFNFYLLYGTSNKNE